MNAQQRRIFLALTLATLALWSSPPRASAVPNPDAIHATWRPFAHNVYDARNDYYSSGFDRFLYYNFSDFKDADGAVPAPRLGFSYSPTFVDQEGGGDYTSHTGTAYVAFPYSEKITTYLSYQFTGVNDPFTHTSQNVATEIDGTSHSFQAGLEWRCPQLDLDFGFELGFGFQETDVGVLQTAMNQFGTGTVESDSLQFSGRISRDIALIAPQEDEAPVLFRNNLTFVPFLAWGVTFVDTDPVSLRGDFNNDILFEDSETLFGGIGGVLRSRGRCPFLNVDLEEFCYFKVGRYCGNDVGVDAFGGGAPVHQSVDTKSTTINAGAGVGFDVGPASQIQAGYHFGHHDAEESGHDANEHRLYVGWHVNF